MAVILALASLSILPAVQGPVTRALESTAKTHTGHVFTVGHAYKLLDAGYYFNPQTPAASTLTLTRVRAPATLLRAAVSFAVVPAPGSSRPS